MGSFLREKEIEDYLVEEVRVLTLPNGEERVVRDLKMMWLDLEMLISHNAFTEDQFIEMAYDWSLREPKYEFTECFSSTVSYAAKQFKSHMR